MAARKFASALAAVLASGWLLLTARPCFGLSEEKDYQAAWQLCQAGRYQEAQQAFKKLLARYPKGTMVPEARFTLGRIETSGNNAFAHYQFILDNHPDHPLASQASYATAQYLYNVGSVSQARERYLATYSRYGNSAAGRESLVRLAMMALASDSGQQAASYVGAYLGQYPQAPGGATLLARLAQHQHSRGDSLPSRESWQRILDLYPASQEAGRAREMLLQQLAQQQETGEDANPEQTAATAAAVPETTDRPASGRRYFLQVGAYLNQAVMEGWRKKLAAQGFSPSIERVSQGGEMVHKLQVGPYHRLDELRAAQKKILDMYGIKAMTVER
jgi:TolA-binding protein